MPKPTVAHGADFVRIDALPRREPPDVTQQMSEILRVSGSPATLRPAQASFLYEIHQLGGGFGALQVGVGKTLISLLAPRVIECRKPALITRAGLVAKTRDEQKKYEKDWQVYRSLQIYSYEALGRVSAARQIELFKPDLLILDECHRAKNRRAAVSRRLSRYMKEYPDTKVVAMSGTIMNGSILEFAHILAWCLKDKAPIPLDRDALAEWAEAIDFQKNPLCARQPGALLAWGEDARSAFKNRLYSTPGVAISQTADCTASLSVEAIEYEVNDATNANFDRLRSLWETPDGWALSMATEVWAAARQLALGFHYMWDPRPPDEWLMARRQWASFVREAITNSTHSHNPLDSELQVANAVRGGYDAAGGYLLSEWQRVKPTFQVNSVPVWHDASALGECEAWLRTHPSGLIWTEHRFFALELAKRTGIPYFGSSGEDRDGKPIEKHDGPAIASIAANATGRNLQAWSESLISSVPSSATQLEQLIGRMHRQGQAADTVSIDFLFGCAEHHDGIIRATDMARMQERSLGQTQKLLLADLIYPSIFGRKGSRWWSNK